jgi:hypothetical protein
MVRVKKILGSSELIGLWSRWLTVPWNPSLGTLVRARDVKALLDLTCATVASMIKGKTPEEIRRTFNIS